MAVDPAGYSKGFNPLKSGKSESLKTHASVSVSDADKDEILKVLTDHTYDCSDMAGIIEKLATSNLAIKEQWENINSQFEQVTRLFESNDPRSTKDYMVLNATIVRDLSDILGQVTQPENKRTFISLKEIAMRCLANFDQSNKAKKMTDYVNTTKQDYFLHPHPHLNHQKQNPQLDKVMFEEHQHI